MTTSKRVLNSCLREELQLYPVEPEHDGSPAWVIHDPLANRHFRLGQLEVELLVFISLDVDEEELALQASAQLSKEITKEQITDLMDFLRRGNLIIGDDKQKEWYRTQRKSLEHKSWFSHLAKSYLFFRIPFWNPDKFLDKHLNSVRWMGHSTTLFILLIVFFIGIISTIHNMEAFVTTFSYFFNWTGLGLYFIVLFFVKILHELGHAFVAKTMNCHVPVIGVAFLVGWPVLYTDTSDAWKLQLRSKRIKISAAGVSVELGLAIISLFCWNFAPEGILKSIFFLLATTTWLLSLLVNLNPLMRFDGYYLLSDMLSMPNLEIRSFTMARWWLREKLFAIKGLSPEKIRKPFVFYAFSIWVYRFLLFLGIALLVYHFFFKVAGIILFVIEILYFIILPIYREIKEWWTLRNLIKLNIITIRTMSIFIIALLLGFVPWSSSIEAPALVQKKIITMYTPIAGKIDKIYVFNQQNVTNGQLLFQMASPELDYDIKQVQQRSNELTWNRDSLGFNEKQRSQALIIQSELKTQIHRLYKLNKKKEKLQSFSPFNGIVSDQVTALKEGDWLARGQPVLSVISHEPSYVTAYVSEHNLSRLKDGSQGYFYSNDGLISPLKVEMLSIDPMAIRELNSMYMASVFGGDIAVRDNNRNNNNIPVESTYKIHLKFMSENLIPQRVIRGNIVLKGEKVSFYQRIKRHLSTVFIKEAEF